MATNYGGMTFDQLRQAGYMVDPRMRGQNDVSGQGIYDVMPDWMSFGGSPLGGLAEDYNSQLNSVNGGSTAGAASNFSDYMVSNGLRPMEAPGANNSSWRWVEDAQGNVVVPPQQINNNDPAFAAAAAAAAAAVTAGAAGAGFGVGGAPTGNALASVADPLAGYMTTGGVEGSFGAGNALAGGAPGATSYGVGADVFGTAAGATPTAGVYGAGAGEAAMGLGGAGTLTGGVGGSAGGVMGGIGDFLGGVSPGQWLNVGGNLLGGYLGDKAAGNAADAQLASGREANALQKYMYDTTRADYAPYRAAGTTALGQIQALLKDPGSITKDPGYLFGLGEGRNTLENSASARGMTYSGAQAKALQRFGQDYAGTKLDQTYNRLAGVAGIGQTATGGTALAGANYGNRVGETLQGMGNVRGSGYVGGANAWGNALSQIANGFQTDEMIKRFGG